MCCVMLFHVMICYALSCYVVKCYVVLLGILLLMVKLSLKYLIGNQGMLPIPAPVRSSHCCCVSKKGERNREPLFSSF